MLREYCIERLSTLPVLAMPLLLAGAAQASRATKGSGVAIDVLLAAALTVQFRMWDDLQDRERDAAVHPERVLVIARTTRPVVAACALLALSSFVLVVVRGARIPAVPGLIAVNAVFAAWYAHRGARSLIGDHVLLSKYPAFVFIIASSGGVVRPGVLAWTMAGVFLTALLYEAFHDGASPGGRHRRLLTAEVVVVALALISLASCERAAWSDASRVVETRSR